MRRRLYGQEPNPILSATETRSGRIPGRIRLFPVTNDPQWLELQKGVSSRRVLATSRSRRPVGYRIRLSRVFTSAVSWARLRLASLARIV
jgi:hypothetical protein